MLELAADEAREIHNLLQGSTDIGTEHLLLGLLRLDAIKSQQALAFLPLKLEDLRTSVIEYWRENGEGKPEAKPTT